MKLPCELIRDLLPLYAEHLTSPETGQLIEEHLQSCPACRDELHSIRLPVPVQADAQADAPLKQVHAALRKKQLLTTLAAVLAVVCALALAVWMYSAKAPATVEEARFWTYNRKEDSANLCILEVQGEGVWLTLDELGQPDRDGAGRALPFPALPRRTGRGVRERGIFQDHRRFQHPAARRRLC